MESITYWNFSSLPNLPKSASSIQTWMGGGWMEERDHIRERESKCMHLSFLHWSTYFPHNILSMSLKLDSTAFCVKSILWRFGQDFDKGCPNKWLTSSNKTSRKLFRLYVRPFKTWAYRGLSSPHILKSGLKINVYIG